MLKLEYLNNRLLSAEQFLKQADEKIDYWQDVKSDYTKRICDIKEQIAELEKEPESTTP